MVEERLAQLESELSNGSQIEVTYHLVKEVVNNFTTNYNQALTTEHVSDNVKVDHFRG